MLTDMNFDVRYSSWSWTCFSSCLIAVMSDISSGISETLNLLAAQNVGMLPHIRFSSIAESVLKISSADAFLLLSPISFFIY